MKLTIQILLIFAVAVFSGTACASIEVGDHIKFTNGIGSPGGIFYVNNLTDPNESQLATFCVEITEYLNFTDSYAVEDIGLVTKNGGKTLSSYAAWLYNSFLNGTLANFNPLSVSDVNTLQLAIWKGVGYSKSDIDTHIGSSWYDTYNPLLIAKPWQAAFGADSNWVGTGLVKVINLRKLDSNGNYTSERAQDQIVRLNTPEPLSLLVWSLLVVCTGTIFARHQSRVG